MGREMLGFQDTGYIFKETFLKILINIFETSKYRKLKFKCVSLFFLRKTK